MLQDLLGRIRHAVSRTPSDGGEAYGAVRDPLLRRIAEVPVGEAPFHHLFIDELFPRDYYDELMGYLREVRTRAMRSIRPAPEAPPVRPVAPPPGAADDVSAG